MTTPHSRPKSLRLRWFFIRRIFLDLTNVSVHVILFPLNLVLGASLSFFTMERKTITQTMLILLILFLYGTLDISLQWWLLIRSNFFSNFSNRKTPFYWQNFWLVLIICLAIIISYNHLASLHEKNRYHYLLAVRQ